LNILKSRRKSIPTTKGPPENSGHEVWVPNLPNPEVQNLDNWSKGLQEQVPFEFDKDTILIWHSLGAVFLLHILDRDRKEPVNKAILACWFLNALGRKEIDDLNKTFIEKDFNRERIKKNAKGIVILHWENDPYIPISETELLHKNIGGTVEIVPNWGHLNEKAGFTEFEGILKYL